MIKYVAEAHLPVNRAHQKWMLERMKDLIAPGNIPVLTGTLLPEDYNRVARQLKENGLINEIPDFISFHRKCSAYDEK
jgi:NitT/TauT family transport system substrate-binding protein